MANRNPGKLLASISRTLRVAGVGVAIAAVALWLLSGMNQIDTSSLSGRDGSGYRTKESFFSMVEPLAIDRIHVTFPSGVTHELRRSANGWDILDGERWFAINPDRAANLFGSRGNGSELYSGVTGILQGTNPANHDRAFGVSTRHGITVTFLSKGFTVEELLLGRSIRTSTGWGTYVRRPDSNAVYQLPGKLTENFSGEAVHTWRRRFLFPGITPADLQEVEVSRQGHDGTYTLARSGESSTGWHVRSGMEQFEADPLIANALCEWIVRLRTADFLEGAVEAVGSEAVASVKVGINGYESPVLLLAHRDDQSSSIIRLHVESPREDESGVVGVFDLLPLWRDPSELVWSDAASPRVFAKERPGANEPFALGAGEKF